MAITRLSFTGFGTAQTFAPHSDASLASVSTSPMEVEVAVGRVVEVTAQVARSVVVTAQVARAIDVTVELPN